MLFFLFFFLFFPSPSYAFKLSAPATSITVNASIPEFDATIFGFTSANSKVEISNSLVYAQTFSQSDGYFEFPRLILPRSTPDYCLSSIDAFGLRTQPVCLPPPSIFLDHNRIGPILLPPTINLSHSSVQPNSTAAVSGQTYPNATVTIHLYQANQKSLAFPKMAYAFSLPYLQITADSQGFYSTSLPTAYSSNYNLFSSALLLDNRSPNSNILHYTLPSLFYLFWLNNRFLIIAIFIGFILASVLAAFFIFRRPFPVSLPPPPCYLPAVRRFPPALFPKSIIPVQ